MLAAGTIVFDSLKELKRLAPTIQPYVDKWIIIDGKFTQFDADHYASNDGSKEWAEQFDNVIWKEVVGWQCDKRSAYCKACEEIGADALLIIDSDEFVVEGADWIQFLENVVKANPASHYHGVHYVKANGQEGWFPRLFTNPGQVQYFHTHNIFMDRAGNKTRSTSACVDQIAGITISQNDELRDPEYIKKAFNYQKGMIEHERPIRKAFR